MVTAGQAVERQLAGVARLPGIWRVPCNNAGMHESHRQAAEQHELAAKAHRTAAEHNEKGNFTDAVWHAERALEYSSQAYKLAEEAHNKSGQIVSI
jgi:hypothetical protein